jgi:hypothetical protein
MFSNDATTNDPGYAFAVKAKAGSLSGDQLVKRNI